MVRSVSHNLNTSCSLLDGETGPGKVALVFHIKIKDVEGYQQWFAESQNKFRSRRLYCVNIDPVPREGMLLDQLVIDEFSSAQSASAFMSVYGVALKELCSVYAVLAVKPEPFMTFCVVRVISWFIRLFKGVQDKGPLRSDWSADNTAVWPDKKQMDVARSQEMDKTLYVYNLNKYRAKADYPPSANINKLVSGSEAYDRYAKIAGFELLRRGAFPVYGGKPIGLVDGEFDCMLADHWDKFIFVRYPQRRNLLTLIESEAFHQGQIHRDAGLERVAIFLGELAE
ncbi:Dimeric alpha-beta barrel [Zooshikella harenae]|uniref:Dimeric alpha-beta barrel n=1 Tax=Zooshikella harenae TaxID=2827238 RepID=A0ABS5ZDR7_9GAMM|nr:Dimeric alpha-beta barrel [Zooshikella harenae]MBU2712207.1 Dimeric alpha-beta barrel [Zooshikella harenae]